jgi:hypothetical protein
MLKNAHVTPGGEIEKRQAFVDAFTAPAGSQGLMSLGNSMGDNLYVVVPNGTPVTPSPTRLGVHSVAMPAGVGISEILDWDTYNGKFFVIAQGTDGNVYRFYDGALVTGAKGISCRTYKSKIYTVEGSYLYFSAVGDPTDWATAADGAGFINLATEDSEMSTLVGIEVYYDKLAVFSERACQIWFIDPDPNKSQHIQTLRQAGTYAPRSVRQYGSGDVLYLAPDGIRSLKARMQSITASVSDIGSPVDPYVRDLMAAGTSALRKTISLLEPLTGRYWVITKTGVLVLSNYPSPEISAWCVYEPGFEIVDAVTAGAFLYLRSSTGQIYRYGNGPGAPIYDSCAVEVILPYLSFQKPATFKQFNGVDLSATGTWAIYAGLNPHQTAAEDLLGTTTGPTFLTGQFAMMGHSTHISVRMRSQVPGECTLSNLMIHYTETVTT